MAASRSVELQPRAPEARYLRAAALASQGRLPEASREVQVGLTLDPPRERLQDLRRQLADAGER